MLKQSLLDDLVSEQPEPDDLVRDLNFGKKACTDLSLEGPRINILSESTRITV